MKVTMDIDNLQDFEAWSGAIDTKNRIVNACKGEEFMTALSDHYPDGISDGELNDLLWFDDEFCCHLVGLDTEDEEEEKHNPENIADENGWVICKVPDWALNYIVNGEDDNLDKDDMAQILNWLKTHKFVETVTDWKTGETQEAYFSSAPEFGKACNVIDCYCEEIEDEEDEEDEETEDND